MNQQNQGNQNYQQNQQGQQSQQTQQPQQSQQNYQQTQQSRQSQQAPQVNQGAAPAPTPATPAAKKGSKTPLIIAIIAILVAAAVGVGAFFGLQGLSGDDKKKDTKEKQEQSKENESEESKESVGNVTEIGGDVEDVAEEDLSVIELYPDRDVEKKDLEKLAKLIDERAKILGDNYEIKTDEKKITLSIEKSMLGSTAIERTNTMDLLISSGTVNFGYSESITYNSIGKDGLKDISVTELDRADILSEYTVNIDEDRYTQLDALKDETIYALEVSLSSEATKTFEKIVESASSYSDMKLSVLHDYDEDAYNIRKFFGTVLLAEEDDASKFYIINPGASYEKNAELMKKVLEQDAANFRLVMQIADEPNWETDDDKGKGEKQVTSMKGETVVVEYTPNDYSLSYNSEVDFAEYEKIIKKRMDVLGIDYMFGTTGFDDKTYCLKLAPQDFAPDFFRLIFGSRSVSVRSSFDSVSSFYKFDIVENGDSYALRMYSMDSAEDITANNNISEGMLYFVANDVTIASANISQMQENTDEDIYYDYYLDFADFTCFGDTKVSSEEKNILDLILHVYDGDYASIEGTFRFRSYGKDNKEKQLSLNDIDWKYSSLTAEDERIFDIIADKGHSVQKLVDGRNILNIIIDLPVDEDLPANFVEEVKDIYSACNFDGGAYNEIIFVIKDETKSSPADQFRIKGYKDTYDGKIILSDYVSGPKFSDYWSDMYDITEEDSFFTERSY